MARDAIVLVDASGSMEEIGKWDIILNANRILRRCSIRPEFCSSNISFYLWSKEVLPWTKGGCPLQGSADQKKLEDFLSQCNSGDGVLFLSDGCFSPDRISKIIREKQLFFLPVAIGADADLRTLERISAIKYVYYVSTLIDALERVCFGSNKED